VLSVEEWAEIRRLHRAEGLGIKTIARTLGNLAEHGACRDRGAGPDHPGPRL
jgi:hypothetical protein